MIRPATRAAYQLLHEGSLALARVEATGMRIDVDRLNKVEADTNTKIRDVEEKIRKDKTYEVWRRRFGRKTNLESDQQLATVLYEELGHKCLYFTEPTEKHPNGQPSVASAALEHIDLPFIKQIQSLAKYKKLISTNIKGLRREIVGDRIHPNSNLNTVVTYRSSMDHPNPQNIPIRDEELAIIRQVFIPSGSKYRLVDRDFKGIEVGVGCCYHKDPRMIKYVKTDPGAMHTDMAIQCYKLTREQLGDTDKGIGKKVRYCAKNMFVFPEFYGSYFPQCAKPLWEAIERMGLTTADGTSLRKILKRQGIRELGACDKQKRPVQGTFEYHIKEVEQDFWGRRFPVYKQWKDDWYEAYLKSGGFNTLTGFRLQGHYGRNDVINYPVQGSAFHCLLWVLIRLVRWLEKHRMKSKVIVQIHDSITGDVHEDEYDDYNAKVDELVSVDLPKAWPWIIVPLETEIEASDPGGSWYEKKKIKEAA